MPRGRFSAALLEGSLDVKAENVPLNAKERVELEWLRSRVAALEALLRRHGIEPLSAKGMPLEEAPKPTPARMEAEVVQLLSESGLGHYVNAFVKQGFCDFYSMRGLQETHMRDLGMLPGDALRLRLKLQEHEPERDKKSDVHRWAPSFLQRQPGVYRCVHVPRVAIRAAPSRNARMLLTLQTGDLIRISHIVPPCWGKVDESELWARLTTSWPIRPKILPPLGEDGELLDVSNGEEEDAIRVPDDAFVLIEGAEAGIDGPLLKCLPPEEAEKAVWQFRDALEVRCEELNAASVRGKPASRAALRQKLVQTAKRYIGQPYAECYHDPDDARCLPGSDLLSFKSGSFVDNAQLICRVIYDLRADLGFVLHRNCRPAHLFDLFRSDDLTSASQLERGDLIFYQTYNRKSGQSQVVHVELFAGGSTSVGSLPWSSSPRTGGKDGVQLFENYDMEELEGLPITRLCFCSIRSLLEADSCSFAHAWYVRQELTSAVNLGSPCCCIS
mmetsp:Transcript_10081/g.28482  ORF Transcript_10081/g.28482 Transcript_10081/m.28482 type:complete len:501 (+) Transcript_10081:137-1639(+)